MAHAYYYPFASFSPEWQAMLYSLEQAIPVRFFDLPIANQLFISEKEAQPQLLEKREELHEKFIYDPLGYVAQMAGYEDSERWWERTFEQWDAIEGIFPKILELMTELRMEFADMQSMLTLRREAYMRKIVREVVKKGFSNIAVVCGAWHAPAIQQWQSIPPKRDNALLKGLKKVKTLSTWIPWSYENISIMTGYGAGIVSPAWYNLLFHNHGDVTYMWMAKAAQLFRAEKMDISPAHVQEGIRLAEALAAMRDLYVPGLTELWDATRSVFCEGNTVMMNIIKERLIIGNKVGKVSSKIRMVVPLQKDLEKCIKSARLSKYWEYPEEVEKVLDLRKETNLLASRLLYRLHILSIYWGEVQSASETRLGSFSETWILKWEPSFTIQIVQAAMWGNTMQEAATKKIRNQAAESPSLPVLAELIEQCLYADLPEAVADVSQHLLSHSTYTKDVFVLMDALPSIVNALRYGSTRKIQLHALESVLIILVPRICSGLPAACVAMDEDASKDILQKILKINHYINILQNATYSIDWIQTLERLADKNNISALIRGGVIRLLFDKEQIDDDQISQRMHYALSANQPSMDASQWLEGFLQNSGLLLIHQPRLWTIIDKWVADLSEDNFQQALPILRRTFSNFSAPERRKMMEMAKRGVQPVEEDIVEEIVDVESAEEVLGVLGKILRSE